MICTSSPKLRQRLWRGQIMATGVNGLVTMLTPERKQLMLLLRIHLTYLILVLVSVSAANFAAVNGKKRVPIYTYCAENYFGYDCKGKCNCGDKRLFECDDGPYGDGRCFCIFFWEILQKFMESCLKKVE